MKYIGLKKIEIVHTELSFTLIAGTFLSFKNIVLADSFEIARRLSEYTRVSLWFVYDVLLLTKIYFARERLKLLMEYSLPLCVLLKNDEIVYVTSL
jgi:hypothetical protein